MTLRGEERGRAEVKLKLGNRGMILQKRFGSLLAMEEEFTEWQDLSGRAVQTGGNTKLRLMS